MPTAALRGIDCYYELGGSGPRTLFLNGSGATIEQLSPLLDIFRDRVELLVHDQRGLGRTSLPDAMPTMADFGLDALALADHVGWDRFGVVGISFGGMVAQEVAVTAPERMERLALLCTSPGGAGGSSYPLHELGPNDRTPLLLDTRFTPEYLAENPGEAMLVDGFVGQGAAPTVGATRQLEARRHHDVWDRLERITCPTRISAGRFDGIALLSNSEAIASRISGADLRVYEGGHTFFAQDAQALPELLDFLAAAS
ncbi:MAG: alpha/beta hydrolase [Acidimicrobiales bacterium]|nr:alpha/beta hydrolase [Acidimicrobiales bacterium]